MKKTILMGLVIGAIATTMVASSTIPAAYAQLSDNGASSLAGPAGGWMPMERPPHVQSGDPAAENPGNSGLEAGIIGPDLKCVVGQPPCK